jgi:hypothetical protein
MVELIKSVGKRELMREARIAMRTIDAVHHSGKGVSDADLRRLVGASARISSKNEVADQQAATAVS